MAQDPKLLKPGYVTDLPTQWIDYSKPRTNELLIAQIVDQFECALTSFLQSFE